MTERLYPVALRLEGRRCLVVGAGPVAARKAEGLAACGARVRIVAPVVSNEMIAVSERCAHVVLERRAYQEGEAAGYHLVVTATDDAAVNARVHADAETSGVWVNSADDPERCSFYLPAVHRVDPIVVSVSTGGASPALAGWLRDRVAEVVTADHAAWAQRLGRARDALRRAGRSTEGLPWLALLDRLHDATASGCGGGDLVDAFVRNHS